MTPPEKDSDQCQRAKGYHRIIENCKQTWLKVTHRSSKIREIYKRFPRLFQLAALYLAVGLVAAGIFYWQLWNLRVTHPYVAENSPGPEEGFPRVEGPLEITTVERPVESEPVLPEEPEYGPSLPEEGAREYEAREEEHAPALPVVEHRQGLWPLSGDLWDGYHEPVTKHINNLVYYHFSKGLAIKAPPGTEVRAAWAGSVVNVEEQGYPYGRAVTILHDNELTAYYGVLQEVIVKKGDRLDRGERIAGLAGGSGKEPTYLYFEVRENQEPVDPLPLLP